MSCYWTFLLALITGGYLSKWVTLDKIFKWKEHLHHPLLVSENYLPDILCQNIGSRLAYFVLSLCSRQTCRKRDRRTDIETGKHNLGRISKNSTLLCNFSDVIVIAGAQDSRRTSELTIFLCVCLHLASSQVSILTFRWKYVVRWSRSLIKGEVAYVIASQQSAVSFSFMMFSLHHIISAAAVSILMVLLLFLG